MIYDLCQHIFDNDPEKGTAADRVQLSAKNLIIQDIRVPAAMLDGKVRHFAAFPILIEKASGGWTRALTRDEGGMA
jgi:kynurenine formamidase